MAGIVANNPYPVRPTPLPPAPPSWYAALHKAHINGVLTLQELFWMIRTRGSSEGR